MRIPTTVHLHVLLIAVGLSQTLSADGIDFETLVDGTPVTNQFPGLTFTNATALTAGISLNEFEFPPRSGANVIFDDGGAIAILFSSPVQSFGGYFTYLAPVTLTAFDVGNNQVGQTVSLFGTNLPISGDPGSSPNEFLGLVFAGGISRVTIAGDPFGSSFVGDDLTYASTVPEPSNLFLPAIALSALFLRSRRRVKSTFS